MSILGSHLEIRDPSWAECSRLMLGQVSFQLWLWLGANTGVPVCQRDVERRVDALLISAFIQLRLFSCNDGGQHLRHGCH